MRRDLDANLDPPVGASADAPFNRQLLGLRHRRPPRRLELVVEAELGDEGRERVLVVGEHTVR